MEISFSLPCFRLQSVDYKQKTSFNRCKQEKGKILYVQNGQKKKQIVCCFFRYTVFYFWVLSRIDNDSGIFSNLLLKSLQSLTSKDRCHIEADHHFVFHRFWDISIEDSKCQSFSDRSFPNLSRTAGGSGS